MFSLNVKAKIKEVKEYNGYALCKISTQGKNADGSYETDFIGRAKFVGKAFRQVPKEVQKITITSCGVKNCYIKDGKLEFLKEPQFVVFDYQLKEDKNCPKAEMTELPGMSEDDSLPF